MTAALDEVARERRQTAPERIAARPLRVALIGGFGIGNFGNDASFEAVLGLLRSARPDAEISFICSNPAEAARLNMPCRSIGLRPKGLLKWVDTALLRQPSLVTNWVHCLATLRSFDVIVFPGTGIFDDYRTGPLHWPSRLLRWCIAARLRGVRIAFLSVGAGPIRNPISRWLMKRAARLAHYRSYRDAESRDYMQGIGVDESKSPVMPDVAFLLPADGADGKQAGASVTVGLGVMNYRGWGADASNTAYDDYIDKHAAFVEAVEARGHRVRLLIGQTTDMRSVRDLEKRLGRSLMEGKELGSFDDVEREIARTDIVVAARYHVLVAALNVGRPAISLTYAPKNDALVARAGLEGFRQDIDRIDLDLLVRQFEELAQNWQRYSQIVRERVAALKDELRGAIDLRQVLGR
jgi:polysaccharide pyruvyl transferase WcaK-like protein